MVAAASVAILVVSGCAQEVVEEEYRPRESHESYREAIVGLELADSELGTRWITAAEAALESPTVVEPPVREVTFFDPHDPSARSYRFPVSRGRRVEITIGAEHDRYFAHVFRLGDDGEPGPEPVAARPEEENQIVFEARQNGFYLLRLQPELLRGGRFEVEITHGASLAFPVEGTGPGDIRSFFGDPRAGGARLHHGVDIFAPRGTPVRAAGPAVVRYVGRRDLGGKVVVLTDRERNINIYYAHLHEQRAERGERVEAGEVIGTVGNTGNARTTPPHLHIGIYQGSWRNPVDPWSYFVGPPVTKPAAVAREGLLGAWLRAPGDLEAAASIPPPTEPPVDYRNRNPFLQGAGDTFAGAEAQEESPLELPAPASIAVSAGTPVRVTGAAGNLLRVRAAAGAEVVLDPEYLAVPDSRVVLERDELARDLRTGDVVAEVPAGTAVTVLGETDRGRLARLPSGRVAVLSGEWRP